MLGIGAQLWNFNNNENKSVAFKDKDYANALGSLEICQETRLCLGVVAMMRVVKTIKPMRMFKFSSWKRKKTCGRNEL